MAAAASVVFGEPAVERFVPRFGHSETGYCAPFDAASRGYLGLGGDVAFFGEDVEVLRERFAPWTLRAIVRLCAMECLSATLHDVCGRARGFVLPDGSVTRFDTQVAWN